MNEFVIKESNRTDRNQARINRLYQILQLYGYASGGYCAKCVACDSTIEFCDKRCITCKKCAINQLIRDLKYIERNDYVDIAK